MAHPQTASRRWSLAVLVVANGIAAAIALRDPGAYQAILLVYALETAAIAVFNALRVLLALALRARSAALGPVELAQRVLATGVGLAAYATIAVVAGMLAFIAVGMLPFAFRGASSALLDADASWAGVLWAVGVLTVAHGVAFAHWAPRAATASTLSLFGHAIEPFARLAALGLLLLLGLLVAGVDGGSTGATVFTVLLVMLKLGVDLLLALAKGAASGPHAGAGAA